MHKNNNIIAFTVKDESTVPGLINAGVYIVNTHLVQEIPDTIPCSLEYDFFPSMIGQDIYGCETETKNKFIDIGTPESYLEASKFFNKMDVSSF